jgi:hypothetical protein
MGFSAPAEFYCRLIEAFVNCFAEQKSAFHFGTA